MTRLPACACSLAALAVLGGMFGFLLVWSEVVIPGWALGTSLLVISFVLAIVRAFMRHYRSSALGEQRPTRGNWTADDGYQPIVSDTYEFTWGAEGALLTLLGDIDPFWSALHYFDCP